LGKNKKYEFTNSVKSMFELKKKNFTTIEEMTSITVIKMQANLLHCQGAY
jgi:hypothetical protein